MASHRRSRHKIGLKERGDVIKPKVLKLCEYCVYKTVYGSNLASHRRNVHKALFVAEKKKKKKESKLVE